MAETIQHILEIKGEIRMYHRLLMFLQIMLKNKCNKKAIQSLLSLMLANRDFFMLFMDKMDINEEEEMPIWQNIYTGEFTIKQYDKNKMIKDFSELKKGKTK